MSSCNCCGNYSNNSRRCNCQNYNNLVDSDNYYNGCDNDDVLGDYYDEGEREIGRVDSVNRLPINVMLCYKSIAFDGCHFYVTIPEVSKVAVFDKKFNLLCTIDVPQKYENITYDPNENVFYATVQGNNKVIYKLDKNFQKLASINVSLPDTCCQTICSLSFNCATNHLVIVACGIIYEIEKDGTIACKVPMYDAYVCNATSLSPYYVATVSRNGQQYIKVFDPTSCCDSCEIKIPNNLKILSIAFYTDCSCMNVKAVAIAKKGCQCNYLVKFKLCNLNINSCNNLGYCNNMVGGTNTSGNCNCCNRCYTNPCSNTNSTITNVLDDNIDTIPNCPYRD